MLPFQNNFSFFLSLFHVILASLKVSGKEALQQILGLISQCREFSNIRLRNNDKRPLNILNQNRNKKTIRFPLNGRIKTLDMKINWYVISREKSGEFCRDFALTQKTSRASKFVNNY